MIKPCAFILSIILPLMALASGENDKSINADVQILRPVSSAYMIGIGSSQLEDTYLTPLKYKGTAYSLAYEGSQAMKFSPEKWTMRFDLGFQFALDDNPARNASMGAVDFSAAWHMMRRWQLPMQFQAAIGPGIEANVGALYLSRNGNNPASAKAACTAGVSGFASWHHKVWRIPITLRYQATLPVIGAFFSPNYSQLYYQIYLGDRKGLAHPAFWGKYFAYTHMISADLHFGKVAMRVAYLGNIRSTKTNNLIANDFSHSLVLGIVTDWITLNTHKDSNFGKIITSY